VSLGIFLEFLGFSSYFSWFKVFSRLFLELLMHWKIFQKKPLPIGLGRARGHDPTRSDPAASLQGHLAERVAERVCSATAAAPPS
jgi:hypothetical protein